MPIDFNIRLPHRGDARGRYSLVVAAVCLILGIMAACRMPASGGSLIWGIPLAVSVSAAVLMGRWRVCQQLLLLLSVFLLGGWLCALRLSRVDIPMPHDRADYEAVVASEPVEKGDLMVCDLIVTRMNTADGFSPVRPFMVRARIPKEWGGGRLVPGAGIAVSSRLYRPENRPADGRSTFDYRRWMLSRGYSASTRIYPGRMRNTKVDGSAVPILYKVKIQCLRLRARLTEGVRRLDMGQETVAVVMAMSVGDKNMLDDSLRSMYSDSGVAHVLALSGLHLGIIYALFAFFFLPLGRGHLTILLILTATWAYVFMVGMSPSVMRSALMLTTYAILSLCFRERMSVNVLAFAAFAMLLVSPLTLYDVGFQLSFMAVLGIILFFRPLYSLFPKRFMDSHRVLRAVVGLGVTSLSAQLATAPIVAYSFGSLPSYFLLANYVVIPIVTVLLYLSLGLYVFGFWTVAQNVVAVVSDGLVAVLHRFLTFVSALPGATIDGLHPSVAVVVLCYLAEAALLVALRQIMRKRARSYEFYH